MPMFKFINSFYSKLALAIIISFVLMGFLLLALAQLLTNTYQQEVEQKLHLNLASHIVHDKELIKEGEINQTVLKQAFHSMMILGPSFEFYILDANGLVTTYSADPDKIKRKYVDLKPVSTLLKGKQMLPVLGDDPRSVTAKKIFSVSEIKHEEKLIGYLYIIIGGEIYDDVVELLQKSHILNLSFWGFITVLFFSLLIVLLLFALLTQPLRRLSIDMQQFKQQGFAQSQQPSYDWNPTAKDEVNRLGVTFQELATTLQQQYQKVKNTDQLRRELISYVSHDLRTPLASLKGYLETWQIKQDEIDRGESQQLIETAINNADEISRLIEQLFELAHLDGDDVTLKLESVSIAELIQDLCNKRELEARKKSIQLSIEPKDPSLHVLADIEKLERVLTNLLDNALRHCRTNDAIKFTLTDTEHGIEVRIQDSGIGIPEEDLPHIFEAHYRASNSMKGSGRNSGLGLAITHRILELHESPLFVESQLGLGTSFRFALNKA